jgi:phage shock protein PspC (stress-responsive transcriptional regulator)
MKILSKRLYRSNKDIHIAGVCGGIAEYFGIDASFVRIAWSFSTILFGASAFLYIIAWIVIPTQPNKSEDNLKRKTIIID